MDFENADVSVIRSNRKTLSIQVKPGEVIVRAPFGVSNKEIERIVQEKRAWIEKHLSALAVSGNQSGDLPEFTDEEIKDMVLRAKEIIPERVAYYAEKIGVSYNKITVRCQRTRWGSCSASGNLNFNCLLVLMPPEVLDSIVVHELCHRKHMNHSAGFYKEIEKVFPDYKRCQKLLKGCGRQLLSRLPDR